jgi:hypothetical protein
MQNAYDLFTYEQCLEETVTQYHNEISCLLGLLILEARYATDTRAEQHFKKLEQKFCRIGKERNLKDHSWLTKAYHQLCVEIWMVEINGQPNSYFYAEPSGSRTPIIERFFQNLDKWIPKQMELGTDILIACVEYREDALQPRWAVVYCDHSNHWYQKVIMNDVLSKQQWKDRTEGVPFQSFRVRPDIQKWSREGYLQALSAKKIDPEIPAVPDAYLRYFGREQAWELKRKGEISHGKNQRTRTESCSLF